MPKRRIPPRVDVGRALVQYTPRSRRILAEIAESATSATLQRPAQRVSVAETPTVVEAAKTRPGRLLIQLIEAGWSLNGRYYPAEVLKRDGAAAFPAGTHAFIDHATDIEDEERPAGSVKNLAAALTTNAYWDESRQALMAEVRLFSLWREAITDMAASIGMSIRAWVYGEHGEAEGRQGLIVSGIPQGRSVDFVTTPAAGGAIVSVLESVQARADEARSIGGWLESRLHLSLTQLADDMYGQGRLTRAERITLSSAIGDGLTAYTTRIEADQPQLYQRDLWDEPDSPEQATSEARRVREAPVEQTRTALQTAVQKKHGGGKETYAWVRDFDPDRSVVWFDVQNRDGGKTWQQAYATNADGAADLSGSPVEVVARIVYDPVTDGTAEAGGATTPSTAASAVIEHVTDGAPPAAPNPPERGEPEMSGTNTGGTSPGEAGTATTEARTTATEAPAEARLAILEAERDQLRTRASVTAEQLADAQAEARRAAASAAEAVAEMRRLRANEAGRTTVDRLLTADESGVPANMQASIGPRVHAAVINHVPLTDAGEVDQPALEAAVTAAIRAERVHAAQLLEAQGVGRVAGLGADGDPSTQMTAEQFEGGMSKIFESIGMPTNTAALAAKGR